YAVLETNEQLSVLKKTAYQTPNKRELNKAPTELQTAMPLITNGEMIKDNIAEANITEEWHLNELERQEYEMDQVFFAEWLEGKILYILPYTKIKEKDWKNIQK